MRKSFTFNGKRYEVTGKTQKELDDRYFYKRLKLEGGLQNNKTVSEWCEEWLVRYKKNKVTKKNYNMYVSLVNRFVISYIGDKLLQDVTPSDCQNIFNFKTNYSDFMIRKIYFMVRNIFEMAVVEGLITSNPTISLVKPKGHTQTRRSITDEERQQFLWAIKGKRYELYFQLLLYCGLRPHEAEWIKGSDIVNGVLHIRGTKSKNADRYVPIPSFLGLPELNDEEYLFEHLTEQKRNRWWKSLKKDLGNVDWTPYCLRHTYCTDLEKAGVPINVAKQLMGHSEISITSNIYTHTGDDVFKSVAILIESFHNNSHIK